LWLLISGDLRLKLFIVYTEHHDNVEYDPYIVIAGHKEEAKRLAEKDDRFTYDVDTHCKKAVVCKLEDYPHGIENIEEASMDIPKIVWAIFHP
jgi:hypothetical protein